MIGKCLSSAYLKIDLISNGFVVRTLNRPTQVDFYG